MMIAFFHHPILNLIVFASCFILMLLSRVSFRKLFLLLLPIFIISVGMFSTGFHFHIQTGAPVNGDTLALTESPFWNGLIFSSRVLVYAGLGLLFVLTTDKLMLIRSLQQQLRISPLFSYGLLAAWNIFPSMADEYGKTRAAFRSRGLHPLPVSPSLLRPMLVKAVLWAEALSIAMESKGFHGSAPRTEFYRLTTTFRDFLFPFITTVATFVFYQIALCVTPLLS